MMNKSIPLDTTLNADLHCHSIYSDGTLSPDELVLRAIENGVQLWALTDHDEIAGVEEAQAAAKKHNLPFLTGVEVSISFAKHNVHIVGLGFDPQNKTLQDGLLKIREGREVRGTRIAQALEALGIKGAYEGALAFSNNPQTISRSHFSRFLVHQGVCKNNNESFSKYLGEGKSAYIKDHEWVSLIECLSWIHGANGMAIIAHPARYKKLSKNQHNILFTEFSAHGGEGVEVVTGSHSSEEAVRYTEVAKEYGLLASRGSDFHSPDESRIDLGALPLLSASLPPVWEKLSERIIYP